MMLRSICNFSSILVSSMNISLSLCLSRKSKNSEVKRYSANAIIQQETAAPESVGSERSRGPPLMGGKALFGKLTSQSFVPRSGFCKSTSSRHPKPTRDRSPRAEACRASSSPPLHRNPSAVPNCRRSSQHGVRTFLSSLLGSVSKTHESIVPIRLTLDWKQQRRWPTVSFLPQHETSNLQLSQN